MKYADIDRLEVIQEKENRRKGIIISIGIHALILILFFLLNYIPISLLHFNQMK